MVVDVTILSVYTIVEYGELDTFRLLAQRVVNREYPEKESEVGVVVSAYIILCVWIYQVVTHTGSSHQIFHIHL